MPNWDEDCPRLRNNLTEVLRQIAAKAERRETPTVEWTRHWQTLMMRGLKAPAWVPIGGFRGERGLEKVQVKVGANFGVGWEKVAGELRHFEARLQELVVELDSVLPAGSEPNADQLAAVLDVCAWAHAEWVRIHPFVNGNGRTARLWANHLAMRYGLPPFVRLRPRPNDAYGDAGAKALQGDWRATAVVFRRLLETFLNEF